jgi:protein TonB
MPARRSLLIGGLAAALPACSDKPREPVVLDTNHPYARAVGSKLAPIYPKAERNAGVQGRLLVAILVGARGELLDVQITRSSGSRALDAAVVDAVRRAAPFPPIPKEVAADRVTIRIPFLFRLAQ